MSTAIIIVCAGLLVSGLAFRATVKAILSRDWLASVIGVQIVTLVALVTIMLAMVMAP